MQNKAFLILKRLFKLLKVYYNIALPKVRIRHWDINFKSLPALLLAVRYQFSVFSLTCSSYSLFGISPRTTSILFPNPLPMQNVASNKKYFYLTINSNAIQPNAVCSGIAYS